MSKYTSLSAFVQGVALVDEPTLSQGEQSALNCLAAFGDYRTAESHPGNEKLIRVCRVKGRTGVNFIINRLIERKLIRKVSEGDGGRGLATVYRILIEDPRFPDPKKPASNDEKGQPKPASTQRADAAKPASDNWQVSDQENLPVDQPKPASSAPKTCQLEAENLPVATGTPPKSLPLIPTSTPSSTPEAAAVETSKGKDQTLSSTVHGSQDMGRGKPPAWIKIPFSGLAPFCGKKWVIEDVNSPVKMYALGKWKEQADSLVAEYGPFVIERALARWADGRKLDGLLTRWRAFFEEGGISDIKAIAGARPKPEALLHNIKRLWDLYGRLRGKPDQPFDPSAPYCIKDTFWAKLETLFARGDWEGAWADEEKACKWGENWWKKHNEYEKAEQTKEYAALGLTFEQGDAMNPDELMIHEAGVKGITVNELYDEFDKKWAAKEALTVAEYLQNEAAENDMTVEAFVKDREAEFKRNNPDDADAWDHIPATK